MSLDYLHDFRCNFSSYIFSVDRVQVAEGVQQSKFIVRVQPHNFFSFSRDLENVL